MGPVKQAKDKPSEYVTVALKLLNTLSSEVRGLEICLLGTGKQVIMKGIFSLKTTLRIFGGYFFALKLFSFSEVIFKPLK